LVTCGYSFADQHINALIFSVLENRERSHVIALQFDELHETQPAVKFATKVPRLLVAGPSSAVLGGKLCSWNGDKPQSNVPICGAVSWLSNGKTLMSLGDFNLFCSFLETMSR
jgi:hypothetical protein